MTEIDLDTDAIRAVGRAFGTLSDALDRAGQQANAIGADDSCFGPLCGQIIARFFQGCEADASASIAANATVASEFEEAFAALAEGWETVETEFCQALSSLGGV